MTTDGQRAARARHVVHAALIAVLLAACAATQVQSPSPSPVPTSTPASAPSVAPDTPSTVSASASPAATVAPDPTTSPDDRKIVALILDGKSTWDALVVPFAEGSTESEMIGKARKMETFFASQVALADAYTSSACTSIALAAYRQGMLEAQAAIEATLTWIDGGMVGDFPSTDGDLHPAYKLINGAVALLEVSSC